jgi:hypothetical protein
MLFARQELADRGRRGRTRVGGRRQTKRAAHLLLQIRVKTLNHEFATVFHRWYPDFPVQQGEALVA